MSEPWFHLDRGAGQPLLLFHGIGLSHATWLPVLDRLAEQRRVLAFDLPGFGRTPPLPAGTPPTHENLCTSLRETLRALGVETPVDMAGNSLGGHLALVAAREGLARSVVALSPGGLWHGERSPARVRATLHVTRLLIRGAPALADQALRTRIGRTLAFAVPMTVLGARIPADEARQIARTFASAVAFDETLMAATRFHGGAAIRVPVTVAFGTRDWLLTRDCQHRDELPAQTQWVRPRGWGHVPMWDDPEGVANLILAGSE